MLKSIRQPFLSMLMLLFMLGSAGWMYTVHFCKMKEVCPEVSGACCNNEISCASKSINAGDFKKEVSAKNQQCCEDISGYYNFPVYRLMKLSAPVDLGESCFVHNEQKVVETLNPDAFYRVLKQPPAIHFSSVSERLSLLNVFRV